MHEPYGWSRSEPERRCAPDACVAVIIVVCLALWLAIAWVLTWLKMWLVG